MKAFTDNEGRTWNVEITVDAIRRLKDASGVNLLTVLDGDLLERLASDPILLCDVIFTLCAEQAEKAKVTPEDFGKSMGGDVIDAATAAVLEELADFFPSRRRALLRKAAGKMDRLQEIALEAAVDAIDDPEFEIRFRAELAKSLSGNSLASSESTPAG